VNELVLNARKHSRPHGAAKALRKRCHLLVEFPHPELESVVIEWEHFSPSVFVQLKKNAQEPLQFVEKRTPAELDGTLQNFIDPATGLRFLDEAFNADIVFSARAFSFLQPEPDLVLPAQSLWECRAEALGALNITEEKLAALPQS
jgi:hypothetical protein